MSVDADPTITEVTVLSTPPSNCVAVEPWRPWAPWAPWAPCKPTAPNNPCVPWVPWVPWAPWLLSPWVPWNPCDPRVPWAPWVPCAPWDPWVPCAPPIWMYLCQPINESWYTNLRIISLVSKTKSLDDFSILSLDVIVKFAELQSLPSAIVIVSPKFGFDGNVIVNGFDVWLSSPIVSAMIWSPDDAV